MKKVYIKLVAMSLMLVLAFSAVVSASYAWFVLSESPVANGLQISISGGSTILIAADVSETVDGVTYHYPDSFSDTLNFGTHSSYSYLQDLGGLRPVSTADGQNWFITTYYTSEDEDVRSGLAMAGQKCPTHLYELDDQLVYANLGSGEEDKLKKGSYIFMDFWVVSPGSNYTLRVSTGEESGSFVIDLLEPTQTESGYTLTGSVSSTSASVRVGFLTTPDRVMDNTMLYYQQSKGFDNAYTSLRGFYQEIGAEKTDSDNYQFTIYEPNADSHPNGAAAEGSFRETFPVALYNGTPTRLSVLRNTTVQLTNKWKASMSGEGAWIEEIFQSGILADAISGEDAAEFYNEYLRGRFGDYVAPGKFIRLTNRLFDDSAASNMASMELAGATDDVSIIELERNVPQRIRMYIWLESQDADWNPNNAASSFAMNIEFAGGSD